MMKKREVLLYIFQVMNICMMAWILYLTAGVTIGRAPAAFAVSAGGLVLLFLAGKSHLLADRWNRIYPVLWIVMLVFMYYLAFHLRVDIYDTWDYGQIIRSAFDLTKTGTFSENAESSHLRSNGGTLREDLRFQCPAGILFGIVRRWSLIRTFGGCGPESKHEIALPTSVRNSPFHAGPRFDPFLL